MRKLYIFFLSVLSLVVFLTCGKSNDQTGLNKTGRFELTGGMLYPRSGHTSTLLPDGNILITGGMERNRIFYNTSEIFIAESGKFIPSGNMYDKRVGHSAVLLNDGRVLIAGGFGEDGVLAACEIYDFKTGLFSKTGNMINARGDFSATLLKNGTVLITGGEGINKEISGAEIFNPVSGTFTSTGEMKFARTMHTATLLDDGRVLIVGGGSYQNPLSSSEIFNPESNIFELSGSMNAPVYKHAAVKLENGNVVVFGGSSGGDWKGNYNTANIYNYKTGTFESSFDMLAPRFKITNSVVLMQRDKVFLAGGNKSCEIYDAGSKSSSFSDGEMDEPRFYSTATLFNNNKVLVSGGYDSKGIAANKAWIYTE